MAETYGSPIPAADYPVRISDQLRPMLQSLRRARNLTQAQLAQRLGVVQSRVADIERNPGAVSAEQLLQILGILQAQLVVRDLVAAEYPDRTLQLQSPAAGYRVSDVSATTELPSEPKPRGRSRKSGHTPPADLPADDDPPRGEW